MEKYNGWTNYETWNIALWLKNDQGLYSATASATPRGGWDAKSLEEFVCNLMPDGTPDFASAEEYSAVDWDEIAAHLNAD